MTSNQAQLQIDGNIHWYGVIMLVASTNQAQYQIESGSGSINGALYIAAPAGAQIQYQQQGGTVNYDSSWISKVMGSQFYRTVAFRQLMD